MTIQYPLLLGLLAILRFIEIKKLNGNMAWYSKKNKIFGYKMKVLVPPNCLETTCISQRSRNTPDIEIILSSIPTHEKAPSTKTHGKTQEDYGFLSEHF